jgi:hypothetical protein
MFQPRVKLEFVRRYCAPENGWSVCVDIDPSEEGQTGGERKSETSRLRQAEMQADAPKVRAQLEKLGANVGRRMEWCRTQRLPYIDGDPDIVAYDRSNMRCLIAEVEGASSGQPEQKLYKAIGQIVRSASNPPQGWQCQLILVVYGDQIATHLQRVNALEKLSISALALADRASDDRWLFGTVPGRGGGR